MSLAMTFIYSNMTVYCLRFWRGHGGNRNACWKCTEPDAVRPWDSPVCGSSLHQDPGWLRILDSLDTQASVVHLDCSFLVFVTAPLSALGWAWAPGMKLVLGIFPSDWNPLRVASEWSRTGWQIMHFCNNLFISWIHSCLQCSGCFGIQVIQ